MQIIFEIPDDLAPALIPTGQDPARAALESLALEAYRGRRLTGYQLRTALGILSRYEFDGFLAEHQAAPYTAEDYERDAATVRRLEELRRRV